MLDGKKSKDLLRATMTGLGVGLLCYTDFQISARIPLPTPSATLPPGEGILPPRWGGGRFLNRPYSEIMKKQPCPVARTGLSRLD